MGHTKGSRSPLALVTGASSGMGREVARLLAARGYATVLVARREERLRALAKELSRMAPSSAIVADLASPEALHGAIAAALVKGPVDVLINNAGCGLYRPFLEHEAPDFRRLMELHYFAAVAAIRAVLPGMLERRSGHVINIASIATKWGPWGHAGYVASKAAVAGLSQSLASEYGGSGIRFSYVNPGIVATEYFDHPSYAPLRDRLRRHAVSPQYAARKIVGLLDRPRLELCIPGHYRIMDWFKALSPALACQIVRRQSRPSRNGVVPGETRCAGGEIEQSHGA